MSGRSKPTGNTAAAGRVAPTAKRDQPRNQMRGRSPARATQAQARLEAARQATSAAEVARARAQAAEHRASQASGRALDALIALQNGGAAKAAHEAARQALVDARIASAAKRNGATYQKYKAAKDALPALTRAEEEALHSPERQALYAQAKALYAAGRAAGKTDQQVSRSPEARALGAALKASMDTYVKASMARFKTQKAMESAERQLLGKAITEERIKAHPLAASHQKLIDQAQARLNRAEALRKARASQREAATHALDRALGDLARAQGDKDATRGLTGVHITTRHTMAVTNDAWNKVFKQSYSEAALVRMAGAHPGDTLNISVSDTTSKGSRAAFGVELKGHANNGFSVERRGGQVIVHTGSVARGAGTKRQISNARDIIGGLHEMQRLGVDKLVTSAGGSGNGKGFTEHSMNGYYTWARIGFTGKIPSEDVRKAASAQFGRPITRVEQVMQQPGGPQWWKKHGEGFEATFDFHNSYSRAALNRFASALGAQS